MNCYLCYQETGAVTRPALGLCHLCGAGICERHLQPIISQSSIGMAGLLSTGRSLRCTRCLERLERDSHSSRQRDSSRPAVKRGITVWWGWRFWQRARGLPEPEEAVALVERFLKQP